VWVCMERGKVEAMAFTIGGKKKCLGEALPYPPGVEKQQITLGKKREKDAVRKEEASELKRQMKALYVTGPPFGRQLEELQTWHRLSGKTGDGMCSKVVGGILSVEQNHSLSARIWG